MMHVFCIMSFFSRKQRCADPRFACLYFLLLSVVLFWNLFCFEIWNPTHTTPQNRKKWFSGIFGPRTFFTGIVSLFVLWFLPIILFFGPGSFYRLLRLPKTEKPRKKNKKNKGFWGMSGPRTLFRGIGNKKNQPHHFFGSRHKNNNRNEWHKNAGFTEM